MKQRRQKVTKADQALLKRIGAMVREGRDQQEQTTEELASLAGVARSTLREVEAGRSNLRLGNLAKITRALEWDSLSAFLTHAEQQ